MPRLLQIPDGVQMFDQFKQHLPDIDPGETEEWIEALDSVVKTSGSSRCSAMGKIPLA